MIRDGARDGLLWRKSSRSDAQGGCVSIARAGRAAAIRDSTDPEGAVIRLSMRGLADLILAVRRGALDLRAERDHTGIG